MKKRYIPFLVFICLILGVSVFAKTKKVNPKDIFDHNMHTELFNASKIPCETCHVKDQYTWPKMNHLGCHKCHNSNKPLIAATQDCSMCHASYPVKPANHNVHWKEEHKTEAKASPQSCKNCHDDRYCIKCHEQRGTVILNMHKRNYRYFHSIDARTDPRKCDSCHVVSFCTNCHSNPRGR